MATQTRSRIPARAQSQTHGPISTKHLSEILGPRITMKIPDNATLAQVEETLSYAVEGIHQARQVQDMIMPIIGHLMLEVKSRKLFAPTYKNFNQWKVEVLNGKMGLGLSTANYCLSAVSSFPSLSEEQYKRFGATRLREAARITSEAKDPEGYFVQLEEFGKMSTNDVTLHVRAIQQQGTTTPASNTKVLAIRMATESYNQWVALRAQYPEDTAETLLVALMDLYTIKDTLSPKVPTQTVRGSSMARTAGVRRDPIHA